ncbi:hypothetical protein [Streptomyces sp. NBC_00286]|uniref:hypothetical protein n=1 Tax=Streptomyces sp. NBC_00286 TaxID=2975701 RepID=UPI002E2B44C2|nr:hypothetical protein [Streptomyces sp. NBC_00286]
MRELSARAFPELEAGGDDQPSPIEAARAQRRRDAEETRRLALKRARGDQARRSGAPTEPVTPDVRHTA